MVPVRCIGIEPGEETDHGRAVADMGAPGAFDLGGVLAGLGQRYRVGALDHRAASLGDRVGDGNRGRARFEKHRRLVAAEGGQRLAEPGGLVDVGETGKRVAHRVRQFPPVDEQRRLA